MTSIWLTLNDFVGKMGDKEGVGNTLHGVWELLGHVEELDDCIYYGSFLIDYILPMYGDSNFAITDEKLSDSNGFLKLYHWFRKYIKSMKEIEEWYNTNRAKLLNNEIKTWSKTKVSDTPQDGEDYTDTYPTGQTNVENGGQVKDDLSYLMGLSKKYHNIMDDFALLFVKDNKLLYNI